MKDLELAERYAEALHDVAREAGALDRVGRDLAAVAELWRGIPDLGLFLEHPLVPVELKEKFIVKAFSDELHPYTINFLRLLARKKRLGYLLLILEAFLKVSEKEGELISATLRSAMPLEKRDIERIKGALERALGKPVVLEVEMAPELIAGGELWVRGRRYDLSLRGRLQALAEELKGAAHA